MKRIILLLFALPFVAAYCILSGSALCTTWVMPLFCACVIGSILIALTTKNTNHG